MNKNKKITLIVSIALVSIILLIGVTYALTYTQTSTNQELVLGDIYMRYNEISGLSITDAVPGSDYSNYFEFTISGKNTYTKKDIYYDFVLNRGDIPTNKTEDNRIPDKYLKFKLVSVDSNNQETVIFTDKTYASLNNQRIHVETIEKNTTSEVNRTYRLYMTIDNSLLIGNTSDAVFTFDEWENAFGSIKVNVTGDFTEKEVELTASETMLKAIADNTDESCNPIIEEDGIIYISGTKDCINFNYVWYSGKLWRVTAVYPDGSMKMITDDNITTINWGSKSTVSSSDLTSAYSTSYIREWLNQEFLPTLYNYEDIIDTNAGWYSITDSNSTPTKPIGNYTLTDPVGLLNAYEYYMSYKNTSASSGYLNIDYYWWLITPYSSSYVRSVHYGGGSLNFHSPSSYSFGVRPSVNLKSTIELNGGSGTVSDPYRIKGDIAEAEVNTTLLNTRMSGEYVKFENDETNQTFRIVDTEIVGENLTTKIVLNDYVKSSGTVLTKNFSSSTTLWSSVDKTNTTYWRGYLNNTWISEIDNTYNTSTGTSNILEKGTYYLGYHTTGSYKTTVCSSVSSDVSVKKCIENGTIVANKSSDDYVGLLRVGEMYASQTRDYTYSTASYMWLITPYSSSSVWYVYNNGLLNGFSPPTSSYGVRPSINLKSTILIKSGSGTQTDPFVVGLPEDSGDEGQ